MATPFSQVVKGQRIQISAAVWNALLRMLRDSQSGRTPAESLAWGGVIPVRALNSTGADIREYRPATVTDAGGYELPTAEDDWQRRPAFTLGVPAAIGDVPVVTLEAIPDGQIGLVAIAGVVLCDINLGSAATARFARLTVGSTDSLTRAVKGPIRVLHVPDAVGSTRRCVVQLGGCCDDRKTPLGNPCLVQDGDGGVAGLAQRWEHPDGSVTCEVSGFCADCGPDDVPSSPPPPPPVATNVIRVELLIAGGGTNIRDITVTDGVTPVTQTTDGSGRTTFLVADGTYTVTLDDVFGGETVTWDLTVGVVDSGSGAVTDSFALSGGATVICQFSITSPP